jgi:hypothetical protein
MTLMNSACSSASWDGGVQPGVNGEAGATEGGDEGGGKGVDGVDHVSAFAASYTHP